MTRGHGFDTRLERQDNVLLQGEFSVQTLHSKTPVILTKSAVAGYT